MILISNPIADLASICVPLFMICLMKHMLCMTSSMAVMNVNVRKVAGLHQLHELTLLKEFQSKPQTLSQAMALNMVSKNTL